MERFFRAFLIGAVGSYFLVTQARAEDLTLTLGEAQNLRTLRGEILEKLLMIPEGSVITIPMELSPVDYLYRSDDGTLKRSSNLFFASVTLEEAPNFSSSRIDEINATPGGLFITTTVANDLPDSRIYPLQPSAPGEAFLELYLPSGKPKWNFTSYFQRRFGSRLNLAIDPSTQTSAQREKWQRIMTELQLVADRTVTTESRHLFTTDQNATTFSISFERQGIVQIFGAWSIAVNGTARRHGFANVPCAEFQSELLRQAYKRAGYDHLEDFNDENDNLLFWDRTAAVVTLADSLAKGEWIPWEAARFKPPVGAFVMNYKATTPGHAYMAAGEDGKFIIDNGFPRGLDLRRLGRSTLGNQYMSGVFFIPPGILPEAW